MLIFDGADAFPCSRCDRLITRFPQAGDAVEALRRYSSALSRTPDDHLLHSNRSMALAKLGRWGESEQVCVSFSIFLQTASRG